jgi:hypothetical protein
MLLAVLFYSPSHPEPAYPQEWPRAVHGILFEKPWLGNFLCLSLWVRSNECFYFLHMAISTTAAQ